MIKRRIVYVWDADYPWDVRTEKTCLALTEAGHEVHIVARNREWRDTIEVLPEATVHRMRSWRALGKRLDGALGFPAFFNPRWASLLQQTVADTRADLVIVRDLPLCPTAIKVARRAGVPVILDMAEKYPEMMQTIFDLGRQRPMDYLVRNPKLVSAVERYCLARVDRVIVVVDEAVDLLAQLGRPASTIDVVSNTPPRALAEQYAGVVRPVRDTVELSYLGVMEIFRGIPEIISAVGELRKEGLPVRLKLMGDGRDLPVFRAQAEALGLGADVVEFTGYVASRSEAMRMVAESDIGVCPQRSGVVSDWIVPNKLFDYMALGLPVLSADSRPCARIVNETGAGAVFKSMDAADAARAIRTLLPLDVRRLCGERGRQAILDRMNWEVDAAALVRSVETATATTRMASA